MKQDNRILVFIVAYNAESHIESVLERIPAEFKTDATNITVLIIDDASGDKTVEIGNLYRLKNSGIKLEIFKNPVNQGYGGNQKIGFHYAIENGFDVVALLHGDGQYAPECLPALIAPILEGDADVVFGSRMIKKKDALAGGMPLYKFAGNILLTWMQNYMLKANLSEFHSGYRIYSTKALKRIPFQYNSNGFDFDTDIIIQLLDNNIRIKEVPIPTYYGTEICRVNGVGYAANILKTTLLSRIQRYAQLYYNPKFDYLTDNTGYQSKVDFDSSHKFAIDETGDGVIVLDIGCGPGHIAQALKKQGCRVFGVDSNKSTVEGDVFSAFQEVDLDEGAITIDCGQLDVILMLDIIEHLKSPEAFLLNLREKYSKFSPRLIITTGNIAFLMMRLSLLLGHFNYGKKGILDLTHKRLSTFYSLERLLVNSGYIIEKKAGIPVPFPLVFGNGFFSRILLWLNRLAIKVMPGLFSYQIAFVARQTPTLNLLLERAAQVGVNERNRIAQELASAREG